MAEDNRETEKALKEAQKALDGRGVGRSPWPGLASIALAALVGLVLVLVGALAITDETVQAGLIATGTTLILGSGLLSAGQRRHKEQ